MYSAIASWNNLTNNEEYSELACDSYITFLKGQADRQTDRQTDGWLDVTGPHAQHSSQQSSLNMMLNILGHSLSSGKRPSRLCPGISWPDRRTGRQTSCCQTGLQQRDIDNKNKRN